jgi:hypothetical protein
MSLILDSQTINWYYVESVLNELVPEDSRSDEVCKGRTGCAVEVLALVSPENPIIVDDQNQIHQDWSDTLHNEWFRQWYRRMLQDDTIVIIPVDRHPSLIKRLRAKGFPAKGRDVWYIRTAKSLQQEEGQAILVSEDMDFHDPTKKKTDHKERMKILRSGKGFVAIFLNKHENVSVKCISRYVSDVRVGPGE